MTGAAVEAILGATDVIGYRTYIKLLRDLPIEGRVHEFGMGKEMARAGLAVELALAGRRVAVVSSGDAGIYGMAGPVLEIWQDVSAQGGAFPADVAIKVIPGVTAASAAAAAVGAPVMNDFAVISLSDLLTPWPDIERRLEFIAQSDLTIVIYNPASRKRRKQLKTACRILSRYRPALSPVAVVRNAGRDEEVEITDLASLPEAVVDMSCTVIVGGPMTKNFGERLVTLRGYRK